MPSIALGTSRRMAMQVLFTTGHDGFWIGQTESLGPFDILAGYKIVSWSAWEQPLVDIPLVSSSSHRALACSGLLLVVMLFPLNMVLCYSHLIYTA